MKIGITVVVDLHLHIVSGCLIEPGLAGRKVHRGGEFRRRVDEIISVGREAKNIFQMDEELDIIDSDFQFIN